MILSPRVLIVSGSKMISADCCRSIPNGVSKIVNSSRKLPKQVNIIGLDSLDSMGRSLIHTPRAEVLEGQAVLRNVKSHGSPYYATFTDLKTGQLKGLEENGYRIVEKNGKIIEEIDVPLDGHVGYRAITNKDGKLEELSEWDLKNGTTILRNDADGNIEETNLLGFDELKQCLEDSGNDVDLVNAVKRYNGEPPVTASEMISYFA